MAFPPSEQVEEAILKVIAQMRGQARPRDVYPRVTELFKQQLTPADLSRTVQSGGNAWTNSIQFTRQHLVQKGELDKKTYGLWSITDKGRQRVGGTPPVALPAPPPPPPPPPPNNIRQRLKERLLKLTPEGFERVIGKLIEAMGLREVNITGRTADGGIDGEAVLPVLGIKVGFQAKRWALGNNVGIEPVQRLVGSVTTRRYDRGLFTTTSDFTLGAREEAGRPDSKVVLISGDELTDLMLAKTLGVRKIPVVQEELDEEFFRD